MRNTVVVDLTSAKVLVPMAVTVVTGIKLVYELKRFYDQSQQEKGVHVQKHADIDAFMVDSTLDRRVLHDEVSRLKGSNQ